MSIVHCFLGYLRGRTFRITCLKSVAITVSIRNVIVFEVAVPLCSCIINIGKCLVWLLDTWLKRSTDVKHSCGSDQDPLGVHVSVFRIVRLIIKSNAGTWNVRFGTGNGKWYNKQSILYQFIAVRYNK